MKFSTLTYLGLASTATCEITCGISSGYDKGEKAYYYSGDGSLANFDACSARCQSDSKCQSFAFDSSQCLLYASALDSNFRQQTNSPFLFYDRNCANVKASSSFTTTLPATTAPAAGAAATPPASEASPTPGSSGGSSGGSGGGSGNGGNGGDSSESGSAPTAQAVSTTDGSNTALPGSAGAPGGQLGASKTASSGFSTATATGTDASGSSATGTSSSGSGSDSGSGSSSGSSSTASSSSSGSSASGSSTSGAAATAGESFRMVVLGSLCVLAVLV